MDFDIRPLPLLRKVKDRKLITSIYTVEKTCFPPGIAVSREDIISIVNDSPIRLGAYVNNNLVGYALARYSLCGPKGKQVGYLYATAVLPKFRKCSIGTAFLMHRLTELKKVGCSIAHAHTTIDNFASAKLLSNFGFKPAEYIAGFYGSSTDGMLWKCILKG